MEGWGRVDEPDDFEETDDPWGSLDDPAESNESSSWEDFQNDISPEPDSSQVWNTGDNMQQSFEDIPSQGGLQEAQPAKIPMKLVGAAIAGVVLVIALVLFLIDGIKIKPKTQTQQPVQQTTQTEQTQQSSAQASTQSTGSDMVTMLKIPESTAMNYSGDVLEANGKITARNKLVQDHQVIYCLEITVAVGASSEVLNFYCNYATFNAVGLGDVVIVKYQQVSDTYISVNEVTK